MVAQDGSAGTWLPWLYHLEHRAQSMALRWGGAVAARWEATDVLLLRMHRIPWRCGSRGSWKDFAAASRQPAGLFLGRNLVAVQPK